MPSTIQLNHGDRPDGKRVGRETRPRMSIGFSAGALSGVAKCALAGAFLLFAVVEARASLLVAQVDISEQVMRVYYKGEFVEEWLVSTARKGKYTPRGKWSAKWLSPHHRSSIYDGAPMPWSVFYNGNFAVHGTDQLNLLGRPASGGCVRLHRENARKFFDWTREVGLRNTLIWVRD